MSLSDDMVFRPTLGARGASTAVRERAKLERRLAGAARRNGVLPRLAKLRRAAQLRAGRAAVGLGARGVSIASRGVGGFVRGAGARAAGTPVGMIAAALIVAGVVAFRLFSGQPLEGTGEQINRMFLGDLDDEARAKMATREQLEGDRDLLAVAGRENRVNSQIARIGSDLFEQNKRIEIGKSKLREAFPVNNLLDMLILRARDAFVSAFGAAGGPGEVERLTGNYREFRTASRAKAAGR